MQAVPSFLIGLYASEKWDVHPWSLATASVLSMTYVFVIFFTNAGANVDLQIWGHDVHHDWPTWRTMLPLFLSKLA